jgi:hypothetical protein
VSGLFDGISHKTVQDGCRALNINGVRRSCAIPVCPRATCCSHWAGVFYRQPSQVPILWKALNQSSNFLLVSDLYPLNLFNGQQISGAVINPGG